MTGTYGVSASVCVCGCVCLCQKIHYLSGYNDDKSKVTIHMRNICEINADLRLAFMFDYMYVCMCMFSPF